MKSPKEDTPNLGQRKSAMAIGNDVGGAPDIIRQLQNPVLLQIQGELSGKEGQSSSGELEREPGERQRMKILREFLQEKCKASEQGKFFKHFGI